MALRALLALLLAAALPAVAARLQADAVRFQNYDVEQGLSHGRVRAIAQDGSGYIWIATRDGLNRFDGRRFRIYRHDPADPHSLPDNVVMALATQADGTLWIGTAGGGLARYDAALDRFERYRAGAQTGLANNYVRTVQAGSDGLLWVGCFGLAVQRFDPRTGKAHDLSIGRPPQLQRVHRVIELPDGGSIFIAGAGVLRWDGHSAQLQHLLAPQGELQSTVEWALLDRAQQLWIGLLDGGLMRLKLDGTVMAHYRSGAGAVFKSGDVRGLLQTRSGDIWVGTRGGIARYDADSDGFVEIRHDEADDSSPAADIYMLFEDREGLIWSGSSSQGIGVHDPVSQGVAVYRRRANDPASLPDNSVQAVLHLADGSLWLGLGRDGGLVRFQPGVGVVQHFRHDAADPHSLASNAITALALGRDGSLWVGLEAYGLDRLPPGGTRFVHFRRKAADAHSLPGNLINDLYVDTEDTLWVGSDGGGLGSLCSGCSEFRRYASTPGDDFDLSVATVTGIVETRDRSIWFGLFGGGLARLDRDSGTVQRFGTQRNAGAGPSNDVVRAPFVARDGTLWAGGSAGLDKIVRGSDGSLGFQAQQWPADAGSRSISCIVEDERNVLWLGTADGLLRFDPAVDLSPQRIPLLNHGDRRGYASNACVAGGGQVFLGSPAGLVEFAGAALPTMATVGPLVLNDLLLFNQPVRPQPGRDDALLQRALSYSNGLQLDYQHSVFGFDFAALDYRGGDIVYRYRLDGLNDDWVPLLPDQRSVSFSRVPAGNYRFRVQARRDGVAPRETGIDLRIAPPPWRSPWAYAGYALLALCIVGGSMRRNRRRLAYARHVAATIQRSEEALRKLNDELEARVVQRTVDLSRSNAELQATLDQLRLAQRQLVEAEKFASLGGLVAGISHEINTPLGVCLTAASHLQQQSVQLRARLADGSLRRSELEQFQRAACEGSDLILRNLQRADRLVRSFKQTAVDQSTDEWRELDLEQSVREALIMLGPVLRPTPHRIRIECAQPVHLFASPGALYQIVSNLVLNALQHAFLPERAGNLVIQISASDDYAHLRVADDGRGMNDNERAHAFDPFFTTRRGSGGSGLGLHIVYNLVTQVLRGQIDCDSVSGAGTCFDIRWPRHFRREG
ncbi:two component regulator with propeller domain [Tahibacter aquaticus]|uniref:histidine kinase n=1 Tax=Tahibacter aquaticus TaxID=520092 RepID=A0A4R6YQI2_9GAMM|nr:two-component regulator propeller domain-containing protein [Tahibacter aquaticus]TDR40017.1 two component regulator with propeller domain [Tahibacter aquaticus]